MWIPFWTLLKKEIVRFFKVGLHTLCAPILTSTLYLLVFGGAFSASLPDYGGVGYVAFMAPGLVMMTVMQNAFGNTASSLIQSKIGGSLVFIQIPSMPGWLVTAAYVIAGCLRAFIAGAGVLVVASLFGLPALAHPLWLLWFALCGAVIMASLGFITALWAEKYDQMGAVQNFVIMPLTFLSGVFYQVKTLPPFWQAVSSLNPFYYLVEGFRTGFLGGAANLPFNGMVAGLAALLLASLASWLMARGWKITH